MEWIVPTATVIIAIIVPFVVNLLKKSEWNANVKRWIAILVSLIAGVATAVISGMPTPETMVTWTLAVVGGVQIAYSAFKQIGITSNWLDALEGIGSNSEE